MSEQGQSVESLTPIILLLATTFAAVMITPAANGIAEFDEETVWRGYMTPALIERIGLTEGLRVSRVIWTFGIGP